MNKKVTYTLRQEQVVIAVMQYLRNRGATIEAYKTAHLSDYLVSRTGTREYALVLEVAV